MPLRSKIVIALGVIVVLAVTFVLGGRAGWHMMDNFCGRLATSGAAAIDADLLARHIAIADALQSGQMSVAQKRLLFLIRSEASHVNECLAKPECMKLFPANRANPTLLERAKSFGDLTTGSSGLGKSDASTESSSLPAQPGR